MNYERVIGLEIHSELKTESKAFCSCINKFGLSINTGTCPVCLGLPGALPTINKRAVEYSVKSGLAFGSVISNRAVFERKNYFYPDLSKSYQISQLEKPVAIGGKIRYRLSGEEKVCRINNIHMEEDAGKSIHDEKMKASLIDFNRCGVPLIEIVTEPDIRSGEEAVAVLESIKETLVSIGVSDCKMQEGSLRCDVNLSLHRAGEPFGTRTEMKNLNSFKAVARAIEYEAKRQAEILNGGGKIIQETLKWDDIAGKNYPLRSKENSNDYRYFPDPDLLTVGIEESYIEDIKNSMEELPYDKKERYSKVLGLPEHDINVLTQDKKISGYYENCLKILNKPKVVSNWIMSDILRKVNEDFSEDINIPVSESNFTQLIQLVETNQLSINASKEILDEMWKNDESPRSLMEKMGLSQVNDADEIITIVRDVIAKNPQAVQDYRSGNGRAMTFFIGQVMKQSRGKANPQIVSKLLTDELK